MVVAERTGVIIFILAAVILFPIQIYGEEPSGEIGMNQMEANPPPVAQPLVPEGVFAAELVKSLKMGQAQNEAEAESMLSAVGIEPKNGWIANYPVTPDIISEIEKGVASAADSQKLGMGRDEARNAVEDLKARLGLRVTQEAISQSAAQAPPGGDRAKGTIYRYTDKDGVLHFTDRYESIPEEYRDQTQTIRGKSQPGSPLVQEKEGTETQERIYAANPEVINNYYYDSGPPVVTYYTPPDPYTYLYAWVPHPFWFSGFFFPGFFILHDFHKRVFFKKHAFIVSNHVFNKVNKRAFVVDPVKRHSFKGVGSKRIDSSRVFNSPSVQASARAIIARSKGGAHLGRSSARPGMGRVDSPTSPGGIQRRFRPNRGADTPAMMPPTMNRGTTANSASSAIGAQRGSRSWPSVSAPGARGGQRDFMAPRSMGNRKEMNFERPRASGPRIFHRPPTAGGGTFNSGPRMHFFRQPSFPKSPGFGQPSTGGGGSLGSFQGGGGFRGQRGFSRGGFGGRR